MRSTAARSSIEYWLQCLEIPFWKFPFFLFPFCVGDSGGPVDISQQMKNKNTNLKKIFVQLKSRKKLKNAQIYHQINLFISGYNRMFLDELKNWAFHWSTLVWSFNKNYKIEIIGPIHDKKQEILGLHYLSLISNLLLFKIFV